MNSVQKLELEMLKQHRQPVFPRGIKPVNKTRQVVAAKQKVFDDRQALKNNLFVNQLDSYQKANVLVRRKPK